MKQEDKFGLFMLCVCLFSLIIAGIVHITTDECFGWAERCREDCGVGIEKTCFCQGSPCLLIPVLIMGAVAVISPVILLRKKER